MPVRTVDILDAGTHLLRLVDQVGEGAEIVITRDGRPVAMLVPVADQPRTPRKLGILAGTFTIPADFDAAFPRAITEDFEAGDDPPTR